MRPPREAFACSSQSESDAAAGVQRIAVSAGSVERRAAAVRRARDLEHEQRDVVTRASSPSSSSLEDRVGEGLGVAAGGTVDRGQPGEALVDRLVGALDEPVGVEDDERAGREAEVGGLERELRVDAEREVATLFGVADAPRRARSRGAADARRRRCIASRVAGSTTR